MKTLFFLVNLLLILYCYSCNKEQQDFSSFYHCNESQALDTNAIHAKLIGSWKWHSQQCGDVSGSIKKADKSIIVSFNGDRSFSVTEGSSIITEGKWSMQRVDGNAWGLTLTSPSIYLNGRIQFCGDEVLFNDSYRDGCDNLFSMIK